MIYASENDTASSGYQIGTILQTKWYCDLAILISALKPKNYGCETLVQA